MEKHRLQISTILLFIFILSACYPQAAATPSTTQDYYRPANLNLAVIPARVPAQLYDTWLPLVDYLGDRTGMQVNLTTSETYEQFPTFVLDNQPDIIYLNPMQYLIIHRDGGYEAITTFTPISISRLITRAGSAINSVDDLRGITIALLPPSSLAGNVQMIAYLEDNGLVAGEDYQTIIVDNQTLLINAVLDGQAQAGAIGIKYFEALPEEQKAQLRVIADTPALPSAPFAVRGDLAPDITEMIVNVLMSVNDTEDGIEILSQRGADQMILVNDATYDAVREFAEQHRIEY